jgi:hypothetical protein
MRLEMIAILAIVLIAEVTAVEDNCNLWMESTTLKSGQGFERQIYINTDEGCTIPNDLSGNITIEIHEKISNALVYTEQESVNSSDGERSYSNNLLRYKPKYIPFSSLNIPATDKDYIYLVIETTYDSNHGVLSDRETRMFEVI